MFEGKMHTELNLLQVFCCVDPMACNYPQITQLVFSYAAGLKIYILPVSFRFRKLHVSMLHPASPKIFFRDLKCNASVSAYLNGKSLVGEKKLSWWKCGYTLCAMIGGVPVPQVTETRVLVLTCPGSTECKTLITERLEVLAPEKEAISR